MQFYGTFKYNNPSTQNEHGNGLPGNVKQLFHWMISQHTRILLV